MQESKISDQLFESQKKRGDWKKSFSPKTQRTVQASQVLWNKGNNISRRNKVIDDSIRIEEVVKPKSYLFGCLAKL